MVEDPDKQSDEILPVVYEELRRLARNHLASEPAGLTLDATALVHEVYLRLEKSDAANWNSPAHYFGAAARAMRRILVERARRYQRLKHGGKRLRVTISRVQLGDGKEDISVDILALEDALKELESRDARKHRLVMLRFFAGLSLEESAEILTVSIGTAKSDWRFARAWLLKRMSDEQS